MAIVKQYHKDTDITYVYESESYWDAEKGQSRSKRRLIGKLDPETGEIIPTGKRGRKPSAEKATNEDESMRDSYAGVIRQYQAQIKELNLALSQKNTQISVLEAQVKTLSQALSQIEAMAARMNAACVAAVSSVTLAAESDRANALSQQ